ALLIWLLPLLCAPLGLGTSAGGALTLGAIWLYAAICGLEAPILRAALMESFYLIGRMVAREAVAENSLALAAFVMLLAWPLSLHDVGFQLSFLAVWGLIALTGPLEAVLRPLLPGLGGAGRSTHPLILRLRERQCDPLTWLAAAVGAQLFTAGVIAQSFQRLYLAGFGANLLAVPLAAAILLLALPITLFNAAWQGLGIPILPPGPLNWGNELLLGTARILERVAGFFTTRGWAWVMVFPPGWPAVMLSLAGLVLAGKWLGQALQTTADCQPRRVNRGVEGPIGDLRRAVSGTQPRRAALAALASLLVLTGGLAAWAYSRAPARLPATPGQPRRRAP
ncbi:MAG: ComEC/Rec2 family competence protein, partial [Alicyclobacillus sp.]|nr:ComEC/Rec2 family competence protein [Alicyclobacillus sp.]